MVKALTKSLKYGAPSYVDDFTLYVLDLQKSRVRLEISGEHGSKGARYYTLGEQITLGKKIWEITRISAVSSSGTKVLRKGSGTVVLLTLVKTVKPASVI